MTGLSRIEPDAPAAAEQATEQAPAAPPELTLRDLQEFHVTQPTESDSVDRAQQLRALMATDIDAYWKPDASGKTPAEELAQLLKWNGDRIDAEEREYAERSREDEPAVEARTPDTSDRPDLTLQDLELLEPDPDVAVDADDADEDRPVLAPLTDHRPPDDEEELEGWREARGIPQRADQYELADVPDHEWTEQDQPLLDEFREAAHAVNLSNEQFLALQESYARQQMATRAEIEQRNDTALEDAQSALEDVYGDQAPAVIDATKAYLDQLPDDLGAQLRQARFSDGRLLFNDPLIAQMFAAMAVAEGAEAAPSGQQSDYGQSSRSDLRNEEADIMRLMASDIGEYQNGMWRRTGRSASDRLLEIRRELGGRR
jgi:hypothetical protein